MTPWLEVRRGDAPLIVSFPHTGTDIPAELEARFSSAWLARKDADHWVHQLYDFAHELSATTLRTTLSRSVIDVNRDPSGASLYPGQVTTELCPRTTFDGEALYRPGAEPDAAEIEARRAAYFAPYHAALAAELARLRTQHERVVLYDAHSIRSEIPRLFHGVLPQLNLGNNDGKTCAASLMRALTQCCDRSGFSRVTNGRFKGGWTTRHYGRPGQGVHALQMELACRAYMLEPDPPLGAANWPSPYDPARAAVLAALLREILATCLTFARSATGSDR